MTDQLSSELDNYREASDDLAVVFTAVAFSEEPYRQKALDALYRMVKVRHALEDQLATALAKLKALEDGMA